MARTWNDLIYGPPPRRNRSTDTAPNATPPPEPEPEAEPDTEPENESDIDSEYERELREQEIRAKHRCFNKYCRCFEKDKENCYASAEQPISATPTKKNNVPPTRSTAARQQKQCRK